MPRPSAVHLRFLCAKYSISSVIPLRIRSSSSIPHRRSMERDFAPAGTIVRKTGEENWAVGIGDRAAMPFVLVQDYDRRPKIRQKCNPSQTDAGAFTVPDSHLSDKVSAIPCNVAFEVVTTNYVGSASDFPIQTHLISDDHGPDAGKLKPCLDIRSSDETLVGIVQSRPVAQGSSVAAIVFLPLYIPQRGPRVSRSLKHGVMAIAKQQ